MIAAGEWKEKKLVHKVYTLLTHIHAVFLFFSVSLRKSQEIFVEHLYHLHRHSKHQSQWLTSLKLVLRTGFYWFFVSCAVARLSSPNIMIVCWFSHRNFPFDCWSAAVYTVFCCRYYVIVSDSQSMITMTNFMCINYKHTTT
jgi:hypothetical protein